MESEQKSGLFHGILILLLFLIVSLLVQSFRDELRNLIGAGIQGILIYLLILIIFAVVAPVSDLPLIPLATGLWGWFPTAILALLGWTLGALFAFEIARKLGTPIVSKFVSIKNVHKLEKLINRGDYFTSVFLTRLLVPLDLLSYAFGLFSRVDTKTYLLATFLAFLPYTFALAYLGSISLIYQIMLVLIGFIIALAIWIFHLLKHIR